MLKSVMCMWVPVPNEHSLGGTSLNISRVIWGSTQELKIQRSLQNGHIFHEVSALSPAVACPKFDLLPRTFRILIIF